MSSHFPNLPTTDPTSIYRHRDGVLAVELLIAAVCHLDLFARIGGDSLTLTEMCQRLDVDPRPADVMVTLLAALGYLERDRDRIRCSRAALEFLSDASPFSLRPYYASLGSRPLALEMLAVLRSGRPARWTSESDEWKKKMEDESFARRFTAAMDCRGLYLGTTMAGQLDLEEATHVLDVGGGSGVYACAIVERFPHLRATVVEKPPVDRVAARSIQERGFSDRVATVASDMFAEPLPGGADVHLYSNVLHDWSTDQVRDLLERSHRALEPGGRLVIHDAFIDHDRTGPLHVAEYSVFLMFFTEGKCYSLGEMEEILAETGFATESYHDVAAARGVLTARRLDR